MAAQINRPVKERVIATLLNGATGTSSGAWCDITSVKQFTVQVKGITTATVQLMGSNDLTIPADGTDGPVITSVTADGIIEKQNNTKFVKTKVSAYTSGTIYAYLWGQEV